MITSISDRVCVPTLPPRLRADQEAWARLPVRQRLAPVQRFRGLLVERYGVLTAAVEKDIGKPAAETLVCEILPLAEAAQFLVRRAGRLLRPRKPSAADRPPWLWGQREWVYRRPRGIVGIIGTWNFPVVLNGVQILQALTAGNAVVWKPSEFAPQSAAALGDLLLEAGFPENLLVRWPAVRNAGPLLAEADVDHIVFTGHSETGRLLASRLGQRLISSTLELSGHDAMLVLADAGVESSARAAWFAWTLNAGQTCLAVRRVYVAAAIYDRWVKAFQALAADAGPARLVSETQVATAATLIDDAAACGATVWPERNIGSAGNPRHFLPTVLFDVRPEMRIAREAVFAPLVCVSRFIDLESVLAEMAAAPYALGASVFCKCPYRGLRLAQRIRAGTVCVNDVIVPTSHPATPFGGVGASGWGVTQGEEGLMEMTVPQVISVRAAGDLPHFRPLGATRWTRDAVLHGLLMLRHAATWRQRWAGLCRLLRTLLRNG